MSRPQAERVVAFVPPVTSSQKSGPIGDPPLATARLLGCGRARTLPLEWCSGELEQDRCGAAVGHRL
jgi:hypothetical protein